MAQPKLSLVVVDVRSAHNVGAMLRTADAMAVDTVYLVGITPYPKLPDDPRLPHVSERAEREIHKTALGAEKSLKIEHCSKTSLKSLFDVLRQDGYEIVALEQTAQAMQLIDWRPRAAIALIVGNEVAGLDQSTLKLCDRAVSIPMLGTKESLNVAVAAGIGLYHLRFNGQN